MASDIKKTVEILFGVSDQTRAGLDSIKSNFNDLDYAIQGATQPVANLTADLLKAEAAILASGAAITGLAVATAGDFQTSIAEVGTLLNLTTEQNAAFSESLIEYGRSSSVALNDIVAASYIAISTGTDLKDITLALSAAEQLAVAGATDLETATGALSRTMNAYGFEATEAERVSNALFIAVQNGDTTMAALAGAIGRVASSAAASGVPVEDLLSAIAAVTVAGVNTNETITSMASLLKALAKPSDELKVALNGMSLETNTLQEIMQQLQLATGGSYNEFVKLKIEQEALKAAVPLAADAMGVFAKTLQSMQTDTENLAQAYEVMAATFDRVNQNLVNNIKATLIDAGTPLLNEYADTVSALGAVFKSLSDGLEAPNFSIVYNATENFINEFNKLLEGIATALPDAMAQVDYTGLIASFDELKDSVTDVFDSIFGENLDLTKPEDLALVLQKAVNGISSLTDLTSGVIDSFKPIFESIGEILNQFNGLTDDQKKFAGELGGSTLLLSEYGTILGGIAITIRETGANIQDVGNIIIGGAGVVFNSLQLLFDGYVRVTAEAVSLLLDILSNLPDFLGGDKFEKEADQFRLISEAAAANFSANMDDFIASAERMNSGINGEARAAADALNQVPASAENAADSIDNSSTVISGSLADIEAKAKAAGVSVDDYIEALSLTEGASVDVALSTEQVADALKKTGDSAAESAEGIKKAKEQTIDYRVEVDELGNRTLVATGAMQNFSTGVKSTAETVKESKKDVTELEKTMLELASNEKIKSMEFSVDLKIAQIEAQKEQVIAAFESISSTVDSLASNVSDLWSLFAGGDVQGLDKLHLEDAAKRAEERLQKQLEIQEKLVNAQVRLMDAQAENLNNDAEVRISSEGLEPEIEAFMFEILKRIQVRVSGNKSAFLLGL